VVQPRRAALVLSARQATDAGAGAGELLMTPADLVTKDLEFIVACEDLAVAIENVRSWIAELKEGPC
jgi:hypothetical protein